MAISAPSRRAAVPIRSHSSERVGTDRKVRIVLLHGRALPDAMKSTLERGFSNDDCNRFRRSHNLVQITKRSVSRDSRASALFHIERKNSRTDLLVLSQVPRTMWWGVGTARDDYERANHHFSNPRCTSTGEKSWVGLHINRARIGGSHILALPLGCKAVIAKGIVRTYSTYFDHSLLHPTKISVAGSGLPRYSFSIVIIIIFIRIF